MKNVKNELLKINIDLTSKMTKNAIILYSENIIKKYYKFIGGIIMKLVTKQKIASLILAGAIVTPIASPLLSQSTSRVYALEYKNLLNQKQENQESLKMVILSDIHIFPEEYLGNEGPNYQDYVNGDRKMLKESERILESNIQRILESDAEIVLVPGDLTKDSEKLGHEIVAKQLKRLEDAGKKVFVTNGNHDINAKDAERFEAVSGDVNDDDRTDKVVQLDGATRDEFETIYEELGFNELETIAQHEDSTSYVAQLKPGYRLIVMDTGIYGDSRYDQSTSGTLNRDGRLEWALNQIEEAKASGDVVIGMAHHGFVEHFDGQGTVFAPYLVENYETVANQLADAGMEYVFTGHFHAQDIVTKTTPSGNKMMDIMTGSSVSYPSPLRFVEIDKDLDKIHITTERTDSIEGIENFEAYGKETMTKGVPGMVASLVEDMLLGLIDGVFPNADTQELTLAVKEGIVEYLKESEAVEELNNEEVKKETNEIKEEATEEEEANQEDVKEEATEEEEANQEDVKEEAIEEEEVNREDIKEEAIEEVEEKQEDVSEEVVDEVERKQEEVNQETEVEEISQEVEEIEGSVVETNNEKEEKADEVDKTVDNSLNSRSTVSVEIDGLGTIKFDVAKVKQYVKDVCEGLKTVEIDTSTAQDYKLMDAITECLLQVYAGDEDYSQNMKTLKSELESTNMVRDALVKVLVDNKASIGKITLTTPGGWFPLEVQGLILTTSALNSILGDATTSDESLSAVIGGAFAGLLHGILSDDTPDNNTAYIKNRVVDFDLSAKLIEAKAIKEGNYSTETFDNLKEAIENASKVILSETATDEEIKLAIDELNTAIDGLEENDEDEVEPDTGVDGEEDEVEPGTGVDGEEDKLESDTGVDNIDSDNDVDDNNNNKNPQTSDSTSLISYLGLGLAGIAGIFGVRRKR